MKGVFRYTAASRSRILYIIGKTMDYAIIEFLKGQTEGVTSEAVWKAVTAPKMNLAKTEDALDDLVKDDLIVLAFVDSKTVYAIA